MPACSAGETCCGTTCVNLASDTHNCGACGHDCLGATCTANLCTPSVVGSGQPTPNSLAVGFGYVFWTNAGTATQNYGDGGVMKCATSALGNPTSVAKSQNAQGVALNATTVYWTNWGAGTNTGAVTSCPLTGCTTPQLVVSMEPEPSAIAVTATHVLWSTNLTTNRAVWRIALVGGTAPIMIADTSSDTAFAVLSSELYWFAGGSLASCSLMGMGCVPTMLATVTSPSGVAVDAVHLYWVAGGNLQRCSLPACSDPVMLESVPQNANIVLDTAHIYIAERQQITRCTLDTCGSERVVLATFTKLAAPPAIAYDNSFVYYTQPTSVLRVAK
jgi:hypothetical protein